jgi:hypothetical protein
MQDVRYHLKAGIEEGIIEPTGIDGVYRVPSAIRSRARRTAGDDDIRGLMEGSDFFIGAYEPLKELKDRIRDILPHWWRTDIHHIVENHHLQYLARVTRVDDRTYREKEPCVVFLRDSHRLAFDNAIRDAENLILEDAKFHFVDEFREAHRGRLSRLDRTATTRLKDQWLKRQAVERKVARLQLQRQIRDTLVRIYGFAYHEADLRPLKLIASSVLHSMPL